MKNLLPQQTQRKPRFGEAEPNKKMVYGQIGNSTEPEVSITDNGKGNYTLCFRDVFFRQLVQYKCVEFQFDPEDFQAINQVFKQFFNSPVGTKKQFNFDKNKIELQTSSADGKLRMYVVVTEPSGKYGAFVIDNSNEIDELFPLKSRNIVAATRP